MKKILVAEDEQNIREFVVINLKRAGYDCVEAASGEEALRVYEQAGGDFDVAVLDIMMPGSLDGLAVCKELRQKNATIGIIMLTAKTQEMDKVTGLMMGRGRLCDEAVQPLRTRGARGRRLPPCGTVYESRRAEFLRRAALRPLRAEPAQPLIHKRRQPRGADTGGVFDYGITSSSNAGRQFKTLLKF